MKSSSALTKKKHFSLHVIIILLYIISLQTMCCGRSFLKLLIFYKVGPNSDRRPTVLYYQTNKLMSCCRFLVISSHLAWIIEVRGTEEQKLRQSLKKQDSRKYVRRINTETQTVGQVVWPHALPLRQSNLNNNTAQFPPIQTLWWLQHNRTM